MKKLFLFLCVVFSVNVFGQSYITESQLNLTYKDNSGEITPLIIPLGQDGSVLFTKVIEFDNIDAKLLHGKVKLALTEFWRSASDVTQLDDSESRINVSKGRTQWLKNKNAALMTSGFNLWFTIKTECRDNRLKISVYGFNSYNTWSSGMYSGTINVYQDEALKNGIRKNGMIKNNLYGLSWLAWRDTASESIDRLENLIKKSDFNESNDW